MVDEMHHAHRFAVGPGESGVGWLVRIEHALPGALSDGIRKFGVVEAQVGLPQRQPCRVITGGDLANVDLTHGDFLSASIGRGFGR
ncbi:hypothetical protein D3C73_1456990 [compost metagenome]